MKNSRFALLIAVTLFAGAQQVQAQNSPTTAPINAKERAALFPSPTNLAEGKNIAETTCASCHGLDGISENDAMPHIAGQRTLYLYRESIAYQKGLRRNQAMADAVAFLDADAILKASMYYASLNPPKPKSKAGDSESLLAKMTEDPLLAVKSATAGCGSCHGTTGNSAIPGMPSLTSQHPDYFVASMKAYQSGDRTHNMMQTFTANLSDDMIRYMGVFYALQEAKKTTATAKGDAEAGRTLSEGCANCHGSNGNTTANDTPSIAGQDPNYFAKTLADYANDQRAHSGMKNALVDMGEQEFANLAAFYATQEPAARRVRKPLTAAEWVDRCDRCHGIAGNSSDPRHPSLAGQNQQYLLNVIRAYSGGERSDSIMHAMTQPLKNGAIEKIAAYYAAQEPRSVVYFELPCTDEGSQKPALSDSLKSGHH